MAEVRFYADEPIPKAVIRGLRQRGVDILSVADAALIGAADIAHLRRARGEGRVIVTQDDDFLRLATGGESHAGIVYAPQHTSVSASRTPLKACSEGKPSSSTSGMSTTSLAPTRT